MQNSAFYKYSLFSVVTILSAKRVYTSDNDQNAMEGIYQVNEKMSEYESSEMIDMDERFEYVAPDDVPEGVQAGLLRKQNGRLWKDGIVYYRFSSAYSMHSSYFFFFFQINSNVYVLAKREENRTAYL